MKVDYASNLEGLAKSLLQSSTTPALYPSHVGKIGNFDFYERQHTVLVSHPDILYQQETDTFTTYLVLNDWRHGIGLERFESPYPESNEFKYYPYFTFDILADTETLVATLGHLVGLLQYYDSTIS